MRPFERLQRPGGDAFRKLPVGGIVTEGNRRAILAALFANLGIAIAKFVAWSITGAASLLAEAVHSVADVTNQALLILGGARAAREPTPELGALSSIKNPFFVLTL